jgi:hypothetical protein
MCKGAFPCTVGALDMLTQVGTVTNVFPLVSGLFIRYRGTLSLCVLARRRKMYHCILSPGFCPPDSGDLVLSEVFTWDGKDLIRILTGVIYATIECDAWATRNVDFGRLSHSTNVDPCDLV